jgi:MSHA biogenesis protein MshL
VRAMPDELRQVDRFLKEAQIAVERQVMLEVKIVEVELNDGFQSGIDWSGLGSRSGVTGALGTIGGNTTGNSLVSGVQSGLSGFNAGAASAISGGVGLPSAASGLFGLALAADGFQAVLGFLETRGGVQILSSPRIATLNNQKALLKVGTDEFFVTNVAGGGNSTDNNNSNTLTSSLPTLSLTPFFSGISLDVTPQVDSTNNITLHVRPSVTAVSEKVKEVDLGTVGNYRLPLASSAVNEFDTMVRIQDGNIVAIGGLMQLQSSRKSSGMPGTISGLLGNRVSSGRKRELVVLIKPTIIRNAEDWETQTLRTRAALDDMESSRARVIRIDGTDDDAKPTTFAK